MAPKVMKARNLSGLLSELPGTQSRDEVTIPSGTGLVEAGTVLGEITATLGHFVPSADGAVVGSEGAETAKVILGYTVDAAYEDVRAVEIARGAEWKAPLLKFDASVDTDAKQETKIAQLKAVGILVR